MAASLSFALVVTSIYYDFFALETDRSIGSNSILQCGVACVDNDNCGGIIWDPTQVTKCLLVVKYSVAGCVGKDKTTGPVYRVTNYGSDKHLRSVTLTVDRPSRNDAANACTVNSLQLVPTPTNMRDWAVMSLKPGYHIWVDLMQASDGSTTDSSGTVMSNFMEWKERTRGADICVGVAYDPIGHYDYVCHTNVISVNKEIWCA